MPFEHWIQTIHPPQDGENVDAATTSRMAKELSQRTEYLRQRLEEYSLKNGRVMLYSVPLEQDVIKGDVVYYNPSSKSFGKAIAEGVVNSETGLYEATIRSFAVGICIAASGAKGDILCSGISDIHVDFQIDPASLFDNAFGYTGTGTRGYLSSTSEGKLTTRPTSPLVQIGMFSEDRCVITPLQKDIFESHLHYRFPISSNPASSQNYSGTGVGKIGDTVYVDYCHSHSTMPGLILSFKKNHTTTAYSSINPARIELRKKTNPNKLSARIYYGETIDVSDPTSGSTYSEFDLDWPEYGQYVDIPTTGVSVSFFRHDGEYTGNAGQLESDVSSNNDLISTTHVFKFFIPNDLSGWTNANPLEAPAGTAYRLMHESVSSLGDVWPPTPVTSAHIETNGINRVYGVEYIATLWGLYWKSGVYPPWSWNSLITPYDLATNSTVLDIEGGDSTLGGDQESEFIDATIVNPNLVNFLYFSKTSLENSRSVVLSLTSQNEMLKITDCFTGETGTSGHLMLDFLLGLNVESTYTEGVYSGISGINPRTNKFIKSPIVEELIPGPGINITKSYATPGLENKNCGKLIISSANLKFEGTVDVVSLLNAKEELINDLIPCVIFLPVANGRCRMITRVKIPDNDLSGFSDITLNLYPIPFGNSNQDATQRRAVFRASSVIVSPGQSLAAVTASNPDSSTEFVLSFQNYTAKTLLPKQTVSINSLSPSDVIYTSWERVTENEEQTIQDSYTGEVGFVQVGWKIQTTL